MGRKPSGEPDPDAESITGRARDRMLSELDDAAAEGMPSNPDEPDDDTTYYSREMKRKAREKAKARKVVPPPSEAELRSDVDDIVRSLRGCRHPLLRAVWERLRPHSKYR